MNPRESPAKVVFPPNPGIESLVGREQIVVEFSASLVRRTTEKIEKRIQQVWSCLIKAAASEGRQPPFDGKKFRLVAAWLEGGTLRVQLGISWYREYLSMRNDPELLGEAIAAAHEEDADAALYLPNVLGNANVVLTHDMKCLVIKRSRNLSVYAGHLDLPGGHPEPEHVTGLNTPADDDSKVSAGIRDELFDSAISETTEDLCMKPDDLGDPLLLSIVENTQSMRKPDMIFVTRCRLDSRDALSVFEAGSHRQEEAENVLCIDPFALNPESLEFPATPVMEAAISIVRTIGQANLARRLRQADANSGCFLPGS